MKRVKVIKKSSKTKEVEKKRQNKNVFKNGRNDT